MSPTSPSIPSSLPLDNFVAIAKYVLKAPSDEQQQKEIQDIFSRTKAREAFKSWSEENRFNKHLSEHSAFISKIKHVIEPKENGTTPSQTTYGYIYSYAASWMGYPTQPANSFDDLDLETWILNNNRYMLNDYFKQKAALGWKDEDFTLILGYIQILGYLSNEGMLYSILSSVLFVPDRHGVIPLSLPIFEDLAENYSEIFVALISTNNSFLNPAFREFTEKNPIITFQLLSKKKNGSFLLHNHDFFVSAIPLFIALPDELLCALWSLKDHEGRTPLHYPENFAKAISFLMSAPPDRLAGVLKVLEIQDGNGKTPLHYMNDVTSLNNLFGLFGCEIYRVVKIPDYRNQAPVSNLQIFLILLEAYWSSSKIKGLEENIWKEMTKDLTELLELRNSQGQTLLHDPAYFEAVGYILCDIAKKDPSSVMLLLLSEDYDHATPLDQQDILFAALPILKELASQGANFLKPLLSRKFDRVNTYLHQVERFQKLLPVLEVAAEKHSADVLSMLSEPNAQGKSPLDFPENAEKILPLISKIVSKIPAEQFFLSFCYESYENNGWVCNDHFVVIMTMAATLDVNLFLTLCGVNTSLFDNHKNIFKLSPLLHNLVRTNPKLCWRLLAIGKADEEFPLHHQGNVDQKLPFLQDLAYNEPALFFQMLKLPNAAGQTPMHKLSTLDKLMPLLEQLIHVNTKLLFELLLLRDSQGNIPLHIEELQSSLRTLLVGLAQERPQYFHELIIQKNGLEKTPLHFKAFFREFKNLIIPDEINFEGLIDNFALKPGEEAVINLAWMREPKIDYATIPLQEYDERMLKLKEDVNELFVVLIEAYQAVLQRKNEKELEQFNAYLQIGNDIYAPKDLKKFIGTMLERIASKKAWTGTHPEGTIPTEEQLRQFYSPLLINFELIVNQLKEQKIPLFIAAKMTAVARAQVEGRCATAYEQELDDASKDAKSMHNANALVNPVIKAANSYLNNVLQIVSGKHHGTNVHPISQMQYLLGFKITPDSHRQNITFEILLKDFKPYLNLKDFISAVNDQVKPEMLIELLMMQIPVNYRPEMADFGEFVRHQEEVIERQIIDEIRRRFELHGNPLRRLPLPRIFRRGIQVEYENGIFEAFFSVRQRPLGDVIEKMASSEFTPEALFQAVYEKLTENPFFNQVFNETNITTFQPMASQEIQEQQEQLRKVAFKLNMSKGRTIGEVESCLLAAEAVVTMLNQFGATPAQKMVILKVKKRYEEEMTKLAETFYAPKCYPIVFSIKEHVRPSQAVKHNRRYSYEQEILQALTPTQLAFKCLVQYGVFELKQEQ